MLRFGMVWLNPPPTDGSTAHPPFYGAAGPRSPEQVSASNKVRRDRPNFAVPAPQLSCSRCLRSPLDSAISKYCRLLHRPSLDVRAVPVMAIQRRLRIMLDELSRRDRERGKSARGRGSRKKEGGSVPAAYRQGGWRECRSCWEGRGWVVIAQPSSHCTRLNNTDFCGENK